jgi:O-antigen/teichoic acid export membrane protein
MRLLALVMSNGATSLVSLLITIVIARQDGPADLGIFGVCFALLSLVQIFTQEIGINRALVDPGNAPQRQIAYSRSLSVAFLITAPMILVGILFWYPIVIISGFVLPSYIAFNFLRLLTMTDGKMRWGILADVLLVASVAVATVLTIFLGFSSLIVLATWAVILPVSSLILQLQLRLRFRLGWDTQNKQYSGVSFGIQNLVGFGTVHISTFALAGLFGSVLVGAIRGAATLLGPVNLVTTSMNTMAIRQLGVSGPNRRKQAVWTWFGLSTGIAAAGGLLTWLIAMNYGSMLLGESWGVIEALVVWKCIDAALVALGVTPRAAHRVDQRDAVAWKVSILSGIARLILLPIGGWWAGAVGVIIAEVITTLLTSCLWWISYALYRAKDLRSAQIQIQSDGQVARK